MRCIKCHIHTVGVIQRFRQHSFIDRFNVPVGEKHIGILVVAQTYTVGAIAGVLGIAAQPAGRPSHTGHRVKLAAAGS